MPALDAAWPISSALHDLKGSSAEDCGTPRCAHISWHITTIHPGSWTRRGGNPVARGRKPLVWVGLTRSQPRPGLDGLAGGQPRYPGQLQRKVGNGLTGWGDSVDFAVLRFDGLAMRVR